MSIISRHTGDIVIEEIRRLAPVEEFDYTFLMSCLSGYRNPRDKVTSLLRSGAIIRVKKGLYVFGPHYAQAPYCRESLANLIYGPSYISLTYALSYHGFIPERVQQITSMTPKRNKKFQTPVGDFSYHYLHPSKYWIGMDWIEVDEKHRVFIASPEKALADLLAQEDRFNELEEIEVYLLENLRIDTHELDQVGIRKLKRISDIYQSPNITLLYEWIRQEKSK